MSVAFGKIKQNCSRGESSRILSVVSVAFGEIKSMVAQDGFEFYTLVFHRGGVLQTEPHVAYIGGQVDAWGLKGALHELCPQANHRFCVKHLEAIIWKHWPNADLRSKVWDCAKSKIMADFERNFAQHEKYVVDLKERSCSCREWDLCGIPCQHAVACLRYNNIDPEVYVHQYYSKETWQTTYMPFIMPVRGENQWDKIDHETILSPMYTRGGVRPKKKRRKGNDVPENPYKAKKSKPQTCGKCGAKGHNSRRCTGTTVKEKKGKMAKNNPKEKGISINDNDGPGSRLHQSTGTAGQGLEQIRPSHDKVRPSQVFPSPPATIPPLYRPPRFVYASYGSPHVSFLSPPAIRPPPRKPASPSLSPQLQLSQFNSALSPSVPSPQAPNAPVKLKRQNNAGQTIGITTSQPQHIASFFQNGHLKNGLSGFALVLIILTAFRPQLRKNLGAPVMLELLRSYEPPEFLQGESDRDWLLILSSNVVFNDRKGVGFWALWFGIRRIWELGELGFKIR
ncbi:hypothetical protein CRG98_037829 [Punica granatum]|uniref:SWIM-type domain-containing protein n=1 Tax=Punica granatum TaxID=22663 RepID=A0A2I0ICT2_PUNGR|nr:hypothetical protein CRG98_037829 [Punica granatum]